MSETPRTTRNATPSRCSVGRPVTRTFAEELERKRDEARMECMILKKEMRRLLETLAGKRAAETKESS